MPSLTRALKQYFRHAHFRPGQKEVCECLLAGSDMLAVFPTGAGKSVCYQLPAVLLPGTTLVLSPLISLMQDQVAQLIRTGISATYLSSNLSATEYHERLELLRHGSYKLVYLAPEQLRREQLRRVLQKIPVPLIVIDEAHCITEWGHDFRPAYRTIAEQSTTILGKRVPIAAFTGTATQETQQDICQVLSLNSPQVFTKSLFRPNLQIRVLPVSSYAAKEVVLLALIKKHKTTPCIIYCATRAQTEVCAALLTRAFRGKVAVAAYHAGLEKEERQRVQQLFTHNKLQCITATTAFGMGIDKPDIGLIIHYQLPGSIEQYVQEIGRAGRGGQESLCYLLMSDADESVQAELQASSTEQRNKQQKFQKFLGYVRSSSCRHARLSEYFSETLAPCLSSCDNCASQHFTTLKCSSLLDEQTHTVLKRLERTRSQLSASTGLAPEYLLTEQQLWWLAVTEAETTQEFSSVPGIGTGWISRWYQPCIQIRDKIPLYDT